MSWIPSTRRWTKMLKGRRYTVSCRQLGEWAGRFLPETKEGSYQIANEWWTAKRAEIEGAPAETADDFVREITARRDWLRKTGYDPALLEAFETRVKQFSNPIPPEPEDELDYELAGPRMKGVVHINDFDSDDPVWADRLARDAGPDLLTEKTLGGLLDRFLGLERGRVESGALKAGSYAAATLCLDELRKWAGADFPIAKFDASKFEDYFTHLTRLADSADYKKSKLRHCRTFLSWCGERGAFSPPGNLHSRRMQIRLTPKPVVTFTVDEVHELLGKATEQTKLYVLLMLNCGMYPGDISDLRQEEVDWEAGRITRRRSKTRHASEAVPTVSYKLWPDTLRLLREFRSNDPDRVVLTAKGNPMLMDRIDPATGKRTKVDSINSAWDRMMKQVNKGRKTPLTKPLKALRKTSATSLESHPVYGRYVTHFLGHSPRGIAAIHYAAPSGELFDEAVTWLGGRYGFAG